MDVLDSAIVRELQLDARQSNRELARRVGVAPSTCLERVRQLQADGTLLGYRADVGLARLNRGVQAFVSAQIRPLRRDVIDGFQVWATALPEVLAVYVLAGTDDFLVHVAVQDNEQLHGFLVDSFAQRREVISFRTQIIYQQMSSPVVEPLPRTETGERPVRGRGSSASARLAQRGRRVP